MRTIVKLSPAVGLLLACLACLAVAITVPLLSGAAPPAEALAVAAPAPASVIPPQTPRTRITREIVHLWTLWLDDAGIRSTDRRRDNLGRLAGYLADATLFYQAHETEWGGRLPRHPDTHMVLAVMVAKESSLRPRALGTRGEIGLGQLHGVMIRPYTRAEVRASQPLQVLLLARGAAYARAQCANVPTTDEDWTLDDWGPTLSLYAGGHRRARRSDGTCKRFARMVDRVDMVRAYRARIDTALDAAPAN